MGGGADDSFIDTYLRYTKRQESPEMFHLWVAITILASVMGRKCYMNKGYYRLYPNFFTVLVAGSAKCRKSTAINLGVGVLNEIGLGTGLLEDVPQVQLIKGKITPEKFIDEICDGDGPTRKAKNCVLVHSSELGVFLTKQSYGEALITILTDLFDCPNEWPYKTKHQGEFVVTDAFLCILAATTPDGLSKGINESALHEGLGSRTMWIYQRDTPRRNPFPVLSPEELALYDRCKLLLMSRARMTGEFTLSREALEWYQGPDGKGGWYNAYMDSLPPDKRAEGMYGRKHDQLLRLAMVFAASYGLQVCETHHLEAAEMTLDAAEEHAMAAFQTVGGDETTPHLERLISIIRRFKRVTHSELLRRMFPVNARMFAILIETLIQAGLVERDKEVARIYCWIGD